MNDVCGIMRSNHIDTEHYPHTLRVETYTTSSHLLKYTHTHLTFLYQAVISSHGRPNNPAPFLCLLLLLLPPPSPPLAAVST
ncbi:hypothetical protein Leryth_010078 [Lithospermum erythrorhizon]|nr:hypothetical protein Leryth_010078 [Lithospermum erythrorhizon]